ncbi:MAG: TMEM165/GDT1 family protein [Chloroflexi bacterium]|nr:TMEM165/GDT1 family protein [Chloroflexota bacterium]
MDAFLATFLLVLLAEFGDKTRLMALILSVRYSSPWKIFAGMTLGYGLVAGLAVIFGEVVSRVLPFSILKYPLAAVLILFGAFLLFGKWGEEEEDKKENLLKKLGRLGPFAISFVLIALTEMGDKTQLTTAAMAVRYEGGWGVLLGSLSALALLNAVFVVLGKKISGKIPVKMIKRVSAVVFFMFAILTLFASL